MSSPYACFRSALFKSKLDNRTNRLERTVQSLVVVQPARSPAHMAKRPNRRKFFFISVCCFLFPESVCRLGIHYFAFYLDDVFSENEPPAALIKNRVDHHVAVSFRKGVVKGEIG